mgnify:FL=1
MLMLQEFGDPKFIARVLNRSMNLEATGSSPVGPGSELSTLHGFYR